MYDPVINLLHNNTDHGSSSPPAWKRMTAGAICGVFGAVACNPFELVKTRLQSSAAGAIAIGTQYSYTGVLHGLKSIYQSDGIRGWYRGSLMSMFRSSIGSGSNLASYSLIKEFLQVKFGWCENVQTDMVAGLGSGIVSCAAMNPIDVLVSYLKIVHYFKI